MRYTGQAEIDIDIAMGWYENQRHGLGFEFLNCVEEVASRILESPKLYSIPYNMPCTTQQIYPHLLQSV